MLLHRDARDLQSSVEVALPAAAMRGHQLIGMIGPTSQDGCHSATLGMSRPTVGGTTIDRPLPLARRLRVPSARGMVTDLGIGPQSDTIDGKDGVLDRHMRGIGGIAVQARGIVGYMKAMRICLSLGELPGMSRKYRFLCSRKWIGE